MDMVPTKSMTHTTAEISQWLESWREAGLGVEKTLRDQLYIKHYGDEFRSMHMNHKVNGVLTRSASRTSYKSINVRLSKPTIFTDRNRTIVAYSGLQLGSAR